MASPDRRSDRHLIDEIRQDGSRFRFFQAVRLLALSSRRGDHNDPVPATLRFGSPLSLAFPASEIAGLTLRQPLVKPSAADDADDLPPETSDPSLAQAKEILDMTVGFMGLTGPSGILPTSYTELFVDQRNHFRDDTGHQFLNLFTHRAVSLFYRAWQKHRFYLSYESGNADGFSRNLLDLVGVGLQHLQQRLENSAGGIPDRFLIHYAGLLAQKPVSAVNIAALVRGYFGVEATLESFVGQWMMLPSHEQSALDERPCRLGQNAFVGERLWDRQTKVRLRLGPLNSQQFEQFMPGQPGLAALRELIQFCVGFTLDCDVALTLKREDIPQPIVADTPTTKPRLGYNLWLNTRSAIHDVDDVRFALLTEQPSAASAN